MDWDGSVKAWWGRSNRTGTLIARLALLLIRVSVRGRHLYDFTVGKSKARAVQFLSHTFCHKLLVLTQ